MDMCRVCLSTEKEMFTLDESFVNNYNLLTNLNISLLDGMPQLSCQTCSDTVKYFMEFREKCIASETTLRDIVTPEILKEETKQEGLSECSDNDKPIKTEIKQEYDNSNLIISDNFDVFDEEIKDLLIKKEDDDIKPRKGRRKLNKKKTKRKEIKIEKTLKNEELLDFAKKLVCGICPKSFEDSYELNSHLDLHKNDQKCGLCSEVCSSWPELLAHRLVHVPIGQHKCHACGKGYKSPVYLEHHLRNLHMQEGNKKLKCKFCNLTFEKPKRLVYHIQEIHSEVKFICDVCSKGFYNKSNLCSHIKKHSDKKAYVCDLCGFSCKYSAGLKDHKTRKHAPTKIYCKNCTRPFVNKEEHDRHKCKLKVAEVCPICGKAISGSNRLSRHLQSHSEHCRYECKRCPAKYKTKGALIAHTDRHDNNRTKQCEYCNAKFFTTSVLIKHRRIHTGEKPYVCKVCNKGFTGNHNLKVHMKVHGEHNLIVKKNSEQDDLINVTI